MLFLGIVLYIGVAIISALPLIRMFGPVTKESHLFPLIIFCAMWPVVLPILAMLFAIFAIKKLPLKRFCSFVNKMAGMNDNDKGILN